MKHIKLAMGAALTFVFLTAGITLAAEECPVDLDGVWELTPVDQEEKEALQMIGLTMTLTFQMKAKTLAIGIGNQSETLPVTIKECSEQKVVFLPGNKEAADRTPLTVLVKDRDTLELVGADGKESLVFVRKAAKK